MYPQQSFFLPSSASPGAALGVLWLSYPHICTYTAPLFLPSHLPLLLSPVCFLFRAEFCQEPFAEPLLVLLLVLEEVILGKSPGLPGPVPALCATGVLPSRSLNKAKDLVLLRSRAVMLLFAVFLPLWMLDSTVWWLQKLNLPSGFHIHDQLFVVGKGEIQQGSLSVPRWSSSFQLLSHMESSSPSSPPKCERKEAGQWVMCGKGSHATSPLLMPVPILGSAL